MPVHFRKLSDRESLALLRRNNVGRMAFAYRNRVDVVPLHYVYSGGWLYGRTSVGPKLLALRHNQWVAFEVDEIDGVFDWRSVVVHGGLYLLDPDRPPPDPGARRRAVRLLRRIVPETMSPDDPVGSRDVFFRVFADDVTGRAAEST
ncbi:MAG: pyridoxamine 5'-phosphate oxidase family protein [Gemmatimonadaceae bacterium]